VRANPLQDDELARREFKRILLIKPSSLGDVLHGLPVLHGLRTRYPSARIDWLINKSFAPLLHAHPEIDDLVIFDRGRFGRMAYSPGTAAAFARFVRDLRRRHYEMVIDLQGLFRSGFLARATGAPVRIGPADAREGATWFYTHRLAPMDSDTHAVDRNYAVAGLLGFADVPIEFPLPVDRQAEAAVAKRIREHLDGDFHPKASGANLRHGPLLAIAPGARWETKLWPVERFVEVVKQLGADGVRCVLLGGADDVPSCGQIAASAQSVLDLSGRTSIAEFVAAISLADAVLCLDSAAAHVAAALDKPVICITGPTNPARTGPYRGGRIVRLELDCSPCYFRRLSQCPHDHRCMRDLTADEVVSVVRDAINDNGQAVSSGLNSRATDV
jgi:heptosyltransferase I